MGKSANLRSFVTRCCAFIWKCFCLFQCTGRGRRYNPVPTKDDDRESHDEGSSGVASSNIAMYEMSCGQQDYHRPLSACTVENVRYRLAETPHVEHDNEDRWFETHDVSGSYQVVALFDGHDGRLAVDRVCEYVKIRLPVEEAESVTLTTLQKLFAETERNFFDNIRAYLEERQRLQNTIPSVGVVIRPRIPPPPPPRFFSHYVITPDISHYTIHVDLLPIRLLYCKRIGKTRCGGPWKGTRDCL